MQKKDLSVLNLLRSANEAVSGEDLSKKLGVTRAAIWKEIQSLRLAGYEIEAKPYHGYTLIGTPDKLTADEILAGLDTSVIGAKVLAYEELDSTNDTAFYLASQGGAEGLCVFSEHQKKGRGRMGRVWQSTRAKNLLVSVVLRPQMAPNHISKITILAALALVHTLREHYSVSAGIKWPNDVYYQSRKLSGILTEMSAEAQRVNFLILGIGVNLNAQESELPPNSVSLEMILGKKVNRVEVARHFLKALDEHYQYFLKHDFSHFVSLWERDSITTGRRISVEEGSKLLQGIAQGIDEDGALWLRMDNGLMKKIVAGDIRYDIT